MLATQRKIHCALVPTQHTECAAGGMTLGAQAGTLKRFMESTVAGKKEEETNAR